MSLLVASHRFSPVDLDNPGGSFDIRGTPAHGTDVAVSFPL